MNNKKTNNLVDILEQSGLEKKEAQVYLSALQIGGGKVSQIAEEANNERSNTYYVLHRLVKKGYCAISERNKVQYFIPASPETVYNRFMERGECIKGALANLKFITGSSTLTS